MNKKKNVFSTIVSLLLAASLTFNVSAVNADPGPISDAETGSVQAELVSEITHMRGANERHFQASDGSYVALSYAEQIHYLDEDSGEWVEVDNTLKSIDVSSGKKVYKNRDGLFEVEFAEPSDAERDTVTISSEGNILSWEVAKYITPDSSMQTNASAELIRTPILSTAEMVIPVADFSLLSEEEHLTVAKKSSSRAMYTDALGNGIDLVYDVSGNKVKESIIIDSFEENASYIAEITAEGLTAVLNEDGSVTFTDTDGETLFVVEAPYMFDSGMGSSSDIQVDLIENKTGGYILAYTPDEEWLENEDRVYPVTLDPTVAVYNSQVIPITCEDDTLSYNSEEGETVNTTGTTLTAGFDGQNTNYIFIDYNMPKLPNNCTVSSIQQKLTVCDYSSTVLPELVSYTLASEYSEGAATLNSFSDLIDFNSRIAASYNTSAGYPIVTFSFAGSQLLKAGHYDPTTGKIYGNGFILMDESGTTSYSRFVRFYSSNYTGALIASSGLYPQPCVYVSYTRNEPPEGVYTLGNLYVGLSSELRNWFFDKVEGGPSAGYSNTYGPYYLRSYENPNKYLGHRNGINLYTAPTPTSTPSPAYDYYWYINVVDLNTYRIHSTTTDVLQISASSSSATLSNIEDAFTIAAINSAEIKQKWTLTISPTSTSFIWPLDYAKNTEGLFKNTYQITSLWGDRPSEGDFHYGIDIRTNIGQGSSNRNVYAAADGIVFKVGTRNNIKYVTIIHRSMLSGELCYDTEYLHLSSYCVSEGQFVKQGQPIGVSGQSGSPNRPHLHFQVEKNFDQYSSETNMNEIGDDFNPLSREGGASSGQDTNTNPIFIVNYDAPVDGGDDLPKGEYMAVNPNFIFNFDES